MFIELDLKTSAKVCRAEAWTFVCRELSSKIEWYDRSSNGMIKYFVKIKKKAFSYIFK